MKLLDAFRKNLGVDLRALALMRISIACVLLIDLSIRISDLEAFYTNSGVAPLGMIFNHCWNNAYFSFHTISESWLVQLILFIGAAFFALCLLIGYRTRLFTVLSWLFLLSLQNRNTLILQGGDDLLRMILFWGIFLPWGSRYSIDSQQTNQSSQPSPLFDWSILAYLLQISYVYACSALLKGPEWHTEYSALYYVFSLDQISFAQTQWLYFYPELLKLLTGIAFWFELTVPILFFIPIKTTWFRMGAFLLLIFFHSFNGFFLLIGLFPLIGIVSSIGLIPSNVMDLIEKKLNSARLFFLESFNGIGSLIQLGIAIKAKQKMVATFPILLPICILYVLAWNLGNFSFVRYKMVDGLKTIGYTLRLDQHWGMFAPGVFKDDGWFVLEGTDQQKNKIDLFHPTDSINYAKPKNITSMFKNDRWRKYAENFIFVKNDFMRGYFCNYYLRKWNESHPDQLMTSLSIIFYTELTAPDYQYVIPKKDVLCNCVY